MRLKNKIAVITGGGSGQGKASALLFAKEGAKVVVADWNEQAASEVTEVIRADGLEAMAVKVDVSDEDMVKALVDQVVKTYGTVDILFNNAGIGYSSNYRYKMASLLETPYKDWKAIIDINLNGTYLMSKYTLPIMIAQKRGSIINNASLNGILGMSGADAYTAAKGGMVALSRVMAVDYGKDNVRVNCICPGSIDTPMMAEAVALPGAREYFSSNPLGRFGQPEEIATVALFLASDESSYVTGTVIPLDGGWSAR